VGSRNARFKQNSTLDNTSHKKESQVQEGRECSKLKWE